MRRYGDVEGVEDFIAIGKGVNEADKDLRTPLHYSIAYDHFQVPSSPQDMPTPIVNLLSLQLLIACVA